MELEDKDLNKPLIFHNLKHKHNAERDGRYIKNKHVKLLK